jgi:hypothetical protein
MYIHTHIHIDCFLFLLFFLFFFHTKAICQRDEGKVVAPPPKVVAVSRLYLEAVGVGLGSPTHAYLHDSHLHTRARGGE